VRRKGRIAARKVKRMGTCAPWHGGWVVWGRKGVEVKVVRVGT
jgi:hypothetical protein